MQHHYTGLGDASEQDEWLTMGPHLLVVAMVKLVNDFGPRGRGVQASTGIEWDSR